VSRLKNEKGCTKIHTSFEPANYVAERLYVSLGFHRTGDMDDGEVVMVLEINFKTNAD